MISMQTEPRKEIWCEVNEIAEKVKDASAAQDSSSPGPGGQVILENSPVGESQGNGVVERTVQEVQH